VRSYPALDLTWASGPTDDQVEQLLAEIDDEGPTAVEERPSGLRVFFATAAARERAAARLGRGTPVDVPDEDWAERSQAALGPVRVGDIVVAPPWHYKPTSGVGFQTETGPQHGLGEETDTRGRFVITIQPSMGFGTGHHASTRLCLALLQRAPVEGRRVLDIGTGSGVLAIAAWRLGAATVTGIDYDPDALESARDNVDRNGAGAGVTLIQSDLDTLAARSPSFDLVLANLTGALLTREARAIAALLSPGAHLIVSGIQLDEEQRVADALTAAGCETGDRLEEDGWVGLRFTIPTTSTIR
jgi:ribosomal protein L11 methyltransferase